MSTSCAQNRIWAQEVDMAHHWAEKHISDPEEFTSWLAETLPDLEIAEAPGSVRVREEARRRLRRLASRRVRMFAMEGAFFSLLLLAGIGFMVWTLHRERELELHQAGFLAATSHELKTPITSLRLYVDTLAGRSLPDEQRAKLLENMAEDLVRLDDLIERLLLAQEMLRGRGSPATEVFDLAEETRKAADSLASTLALGRYTLEADLEEGLHARIHPERWHLLVKNLLENARKYSPPGSRIELRLRREGNHARLEVRDEGSGFPPEERERIFQRFYRIGSEDTRRSRGTGLGLYLVREIAGAFGGRVRAHSDGPGKGALFTVELPLVDRIA